MSSTRVKPLRKLLAAGSEQPWESGWPDAYGGRVYGGDCDGEYHHTRTRQVADADLIASAVNALPELLDMVESFARADMANAHLECPLCAGARDDDSTLGYDHYDNCVWLVARRLCGMGGDE